MRTGQPVKFRQDGDCLTLDLSQISMGGAFYAEGFRLVLAQD